MTIAVVAEKPSVARDIAAVLGATTRRAGSFSGGGYVITWALGHLVGLAEPHQIRAEWKPWRWAQLPMLPETWPLVVLEKTRAQFEAVRSVLSDPAIREVVCATDAGREGELIFRLVYEAAGCRKPFRRLWISSLTEEAIRSGFRSLRPGSAFDALASAAAGRSRADWLVGMNLSRAYGLASDQPLSVGRVQTPTLAMVVERELAIRRFVPRDYLEVVATFSPRDGERYPGTWFRDVDGKPSRQLPADGAEARAIAERVLSPGAAAAVASSRSETRRMPPPLLYDLTELQRHANRLHGYSAQQVLQIAQALYEKHKLITYPRTSSRHLSSDVAAALPSVVRAIQEPYRGLLAPGTGDRPLSRRFVDDSKVTDHHALIPTAKPPVLERLSEDERRIYDLICRRLLSAWHGDFVWDTASVVTEVRSASALDRFESSGTAVREPGWKVLEKRVEGEPRPALPPGLVRGLPVKVVDAQPVKKRTQPPPRFTDATLLTAMETAGKALDEKELSEAMRDTGLGTPATRAGIIETLLERKYLARQGKALEATEKGIALISTVDPTVKSPEMTGHWEARLQRIERGEEALGPFMAGIEQYVREVIGKMSAPVRGAAKVDPRQGMLFQVEPSARPSVSRPDVSGASGTTGTTGTTGASGTPGASGTAGARPAAPVPPDDLGQLLRSAFGFEAFRPHQEAVCRAATRGEDALLVMPTGAGKSLCYQLPGRARGGTTLVVSPLIALMEDQVGKLRAGGFAAERIHSGRERSESRAVLQAYLDGKLDFLFIAPERLGVPGFVERLAQRRPSLIAIDEAHCISQWGHDFRPEYRRLGQRLPLLRPAPVIALTATATPTVQRDIVKQLGLRDARSFIHGFRRHNIAVEAVELKPSERPQRVRTILAARSRRPAIVYAPSRKIAESMAEELSSFCRADVYHAGLGAKVRAGVQERFLSGALEVI
ncbi:MAG TPA: DNA topoisomerase 3, partial [Myxococcales bacterium]|nr:DNA topoisomerase 3 [Myxococcales bacterium]